jgi:glycosyltransferase involved in cell wall biosynthesis
MPVELSIIMPCLNEAETLGSCIRKAKSYLECAGISGEIVIGDNGSTDGSQEIATKLGARVVNVPVRGYGAALYGAIATSNGRYCIMGDSDDSYDFEQLDAFVQRLRDGFDLVMGNRFRGGIKKGAMPWKNRYIGNPILSAVGKILFPTEVGDFHCGLRGFSMDAFRRMDLRMTGMEFASEMVIKATLLKLRIAEVPTVLSPDGRSRAPHLRPYRDGWRHLRLLLLFSPNWLFLYPGFAVMVLGLVVGGILLAGPIRLRTIHLGLATLIYCSTMVAVGFQGVLFWILSRVYAVQEGLYPEFAALNAHRYTRHWTLERGLLAGMLFTLAGLCAAVYAVWTWKQRAFGMMDIEHLARIVIPSSVSISLGMEMILFSLMLSTFGLNLRHFTAMSERVEQDAEKNEDSCCQ